MQDDFTVKKARGMVVVREESCKGCAYCIEFCPSSCLKFSARYNLKGYRYPVLAQPDFCTGCNLCGMYCPDFAIFGLRFADLQTRRRVTSPGWPKVTA